MKLMATSLRLLLSGDYLDARSCGRRQREMCHLVDCLFASIKAVLGDKTEKNMKLSLSDKAENMWVCIERHGDKAEKETVSSLSLHVDETEK